MKTLNLFHKNEVFKCVCLIINETNQPLTFTFRIVIASEPIIYTEKINSALEKTITKTTTKQKQTVI